MEPFEDICRRGGDPLRILDQFFARTGPVHQTLARISERLRELNIDYAIAGGLALNAQGYERATIDVDILITRAGHGALHQAVVGSGYAPSSTGRRSLRDLETGVRIDFLISGEFPGDGKPKPISFPEPASVSIEFDGVRYLTLPKLVDLKLASGMTNFGRMKDLADVIEMMKILELPVDFELQLHEFVRPKFEELRKDLEKGRETDIHPWPPRRAIRQ